MNVIHAYNFEILTLQDLLTKYTHRQVGEGLQSIKALFLLQLRVQSAAV